MSCSVRVKTRRALQFLCRQVSVHDVLEYAGDAVGAGAPLPGHDVAFAFEPQVKFVEQFDGRKMQEKFGDELIVNVAEQVAHVVCR